MSTMVASDSAPTPGFIPENTFRHYSSDQSKAYASIRGGYSPELIKFILDKHISTGGGTARLVDLGCGPGNSLRPLAPSFDEVVGCDPSQGMLDLAKSLGGQTRSGQDIRFEALLAEECDKVPGFEHGTVDMITAATAAHWFDHPNFWPAAARALRPGGTVAIWVNADIRYTGTEHVAKLNDIINNMHKVLDPHSLRGNNQTRTGYADMPMPWQLPETNPAHAAFDEQLSFRKDWNRDPETGLHRELELETVTASLKDLGRLWGTASMVVRWREAHPDLAGTEEDIVSVATRQMEDILGQNAHVGVGVWMVLLLVKKKA